MRTWIGYRILNTGLKLGLSAAMFAAVAAAQQQPSVGPSEDDVYCSGVVSTQAIPYDTYLISGENADYKIVFWLGDDVYLNRGAEQGVKVGDEFEVVRAVSDPLPSPWFRWQNGLLHAMGTTYADIGRLRVVSVQAKTSIAEVTKSCDLMQRGDIVRPFTARPAPAFHNVKFDPFAAPSGKKTAMVVTTKGFGQASSAGAIVYVNLGSAQGVQVGDYFRVFRYAGTLNQTMYQVRDTGYKMYGWGSTPVPYSWNTVPRQVLGEGIVMRTGPNSSTVLLTIASEEIYVGDYVELE